MSAPDCLFMVGNVKGPSVGGSTPLACQLSNSPSAQPLAPHHAGLSPRCPGTGMHPLAVQTHGTHVSVRLPAQCHLVPHAPGCAGLTPHQQAAGDPAAVPLYPVVQGGREGGGWVLVDMGPARTSNNAQCTLRCKQPAQLMLRVMCVVRQATTCALRHHQCGMLALMLMMLLGQNAPRQQHGAAYNHAADTPT